MEINLLPHEEKFLQSLINKMESNFYTIVTGNSGCGKSYTFAAFYNRIENSSSEQVIIFDSDYIYEERDYSAFKKSMNNIKLYKEYIKDGTIEAAKDTPFVGNIVSYLISSFVKPKPSVDLQFLNEDELIILNYLKKTLKSKKLYVICDNIHWWDRRSLLLLVQLITKPNIFTDEEYKRIRFVLSITNNQNSLNEDILNEIQSSTDKTKKIPFAIFEYNDFKQNLFYKSNHKLIDSQVELLYNLVNGHLKVYFEIIQEIADNSFDFDSSYENNKNYLDMILKRRLKEYGASGDQITEVLEYASIIGMTFSHYELEIITDSEKSKIKTIIADSNSLRLTENTDKVEQYKFAHDIIRDVFLSKVNSSHIDYYAKISSCLKQIKPGQYLRRARYMVSALKYKEASILYMLHLIQQLRVYGNILDNILDEATKLFDDIQVEYLEQMIQAYNFYNAKDYASSLKHLELILGYYPNELLAERDILKLRCYSKKLATNKTIMAVRQLEKKRMNNFFSGEVEVWERYNHALIIAYAHLGKISKARSIEEELLNSLSERLDYDEGARNRINIIKRNANSIHGIDVAPIFIKQAVDYFGQKENSNNYKNIKQYYTSLTNYSAILIKQGEFLKSYENTSAALQLEKENPHFRFPRTQILKNNFIISGILSKKVELSQGILLYHDILNNLEDGIAERLFYASNLSILYALDDRIYDAYKVIDMEGKKHNIETDREGLYKYRYITNNSIYLYLLGNSSEALKNLRRINDTLERLINGTFFKKKNELLISIMEKNTICSGNEWLHIVHQCCLSFQGKPWRYFGLGYAFAALCNWET